MGARGGLSLLRRRYTRSVNACWRSVHHQYDLAGYVETGIVVMLLRRRGNPCPHKHDRSVRTAVGRSLAGENVSKIVGRSIAVERQLERSFRRIGFGGDHFKGLQETAAIARAAETVRFKVRC